MAVMAARPQVSGISIRKRRVHKKSRNGCRNCKLRSVKCDEGKPTCKKCASYGVVCTYVRTSSELQLSVEGANHIILPPGLPYWGCKSDELLDKFQVRTALTVSFGERLYVYQRDITTLASSNPSLYHAIVTLTMSHDRYLSSGPDLKPSTEEFYHWSRALSGFNKQLSRSPRDDEASALLTTAAMLGMLTFFHMDATTPEEAWPLAPPSQSDLTWLNMSNGKKEVFKLTQQSKSEPTPLFRKLSEIYTNGLLPTPSGTRPSKVDVSTPLELSRLYNLNKGTPDTDKSDDPLQWAAGRLALVLATDCAPNTVVLGFLLFISAMRPDFKQLLEQKEPRALLLLAWWYAKTNQIGLWWLSARSHLEGMAICLYLERQYPYDKDVQALVQYPKGVFEAGSGK